MTLSQAIHEGCKIRTQQSFGIMFDQGSSCALGAAYEGWIGKKVEDQNETHDLTRSIFEKMYEKFPILLNVVELPVKGDDIPLLHAIIRLNDVSGWNRERIACWVETLEKEVSS